MAEVSFLPSANTGRASAGREGTGKIFSTSEWGEMGQNFCGEFLQKFRNQ